MNTYTVNYLVYEADSTFVLTEGTMQIQAPQAGQAEAQVRAMFQGNNVIIRSVFG